MSLQPDEEGEIRILPVNRNEAQTQVQVMFSSQDSGNTRGEYIGDPESVAVASNQYSIDK